MGFDGAAGFHPAEIGGGGGAFYQTVQDEGVSLPQRLALNFVGPGVTVTDIAGVTTVAIPGGGGMTGTYGSFFDTTSQTTLGNTEEIMTFNTVDLSATAGVTLVGGSKMTATVDGVYNLQFSAQLRKTSGGQAQLIYIYFKKNGLVIPDSATALTLANNNQLVVAAWNFFVQLNAGEYVEIAWYATSPNIELIYEPAPAAGVPNIPSVIATIQQVG